MQPVDATVRTPGTTPDFSTGMAYMNRPSRDHNRSSTMLSRSMSRSVAGDDGDDATSVARDLGRMDLGFGSPVHSSR